MTEYTFPADDEPIAEPAPPPKPSKVSKEDRLELENFQVKLQNVQLQLQIMQADLAKALTERNTLVEGMKKKREEMQDKYGVDIARVTIADDGTITPIPPQASTPNPFQHIIKPPGTP